MPAEQDNFTTALLGWYDRAQRPLPWRRRPGSGDAVDPYAVLVSELMLQQTQVATVIPYFQRFMERFPTPAALASASEQEVLRLWQGLGYYSRARNLQNAARRIVSEHAAAVPGTLDALLDLPGVGRYTAGAVASIAFEQRAPILDGNVMRVLCRLDALRDDPRQPAVRQRLWRRAEEILPGQRIGDFNSALMELGATVCTPKKPCCLVCPVRAWCQAAEAGVQDAIPPPRAAKATPMVRRWTLCLRRRGKWLIEQRPSHGRWAGMWQFITLTNRPGPAMLKQFERLGKIEHALTHRRYTFHVYRGDWRGEAPGGELPRKWVTLEELRDYPLPRPHVRIAEMLAGGA